jgi:hypothetical protein
MLLYAAVPALATLVAELFSCLEGTRCFLTVRELETLVEVLYSCLEETRCFL